MKFCISIDGLKESEIHNINVHDLSEFLFTQLQKVLLFKISSHPSGHHLCKIAMSTILIIYNINSNEAINISCDGKNFVIKLESER